MSTNRAARGCAAPVTIAVLGPYHSRNFGDTAIQMAVLQNLRSRLPCAEFVGVSTDPLDTFRAHGIAAFPLSGAMRGVVRTMPTSPATPTSIGVGRRLHGLLERVTPRCFAALARLRNIYRCVGSIDLLLISGSGQLDDFWGGAWAHPYNLLVWTAIARVRGRKVAILGIGLDDLSSRVGRLFAHTAVRLSHYRAYRDRGTLEYHEAAGLGPAHTCPDPAFSLSLPPGTELHVRERAQPVIMVCPISERAWMTGSVTDTYTRYLDVLIETCERLIAMGFMVRLSNSQASMDAPLVDKVGAILIARVGDRGIQIAKAHTVQEYIAGVLAVDAVIASRLHAVILALVAGVPVVAVSYSRKVAQLMHELKFSEACIDLTRVSTGKLVSMVEQAFGNAAELRARIRATNVHLRAALDAEYDAIVRMLPTFGAA